LGVTRDSVYKWIEADPELKQAIETIRESMLDMTEGALFKQISEGNPAAIFFHLKTIGKKRGYIEKSETDITSNGKTILQSMPDEELNRKIEELNQKFNAK
jgi:hypothetical protein